MTYSAYQFTIFRVFFGTYLTLYFIDMYPFVEPIFANQNLVLPYSGPLDFNSISNFLGLFKSPAHTQLLILTMVALSILFTFGFFRRFAALGIWVGLVSLAYRNTIYQNVSHNFMGWLLLASIAIPSGEPFSIYPRKNFDWQMPKLLFWGAWLILGSGYSLSGIDKINYSPWQDGSAIQGLLMGRQGTYGLIRDVFLNLPPMALKLITWFTVYLEMLFLPLAFWRETRFWAWLGMASMHLGIYFLMNLGDLTLALFAFHIFTFDQTSVPYFIRNYVTDIYSRILHLIKTKGFLPKKLAK